MVLADGSTEARARGLRVSLHGRERLNPYIATTDVVFSLVFVFVIMLVSATAIDTLRGLRLTHLARALEVRSAIEDMDPESRPVLVPVDQRNDPAGTQRWRFSGGQLFVSGSSELTDRGRAAIHAFGVVLAGQPNWRRIRVEGHTVMTRRDEPDDWALSAALATSVVQELVKVTGINPWDVGVAGRGGQAPVRQRIDDPMVDERVEIVIEYCTVEQCARGEVVVR